MKKSTLLAAALLLGSASLFAADPQLLNMTPSDAQMYAGINVEQAKTSQFGQFLLSNMPVDANFQEFITSTGFDPRTDLREILIVTTGAPAPTLKSTHSGLMLAKGTFNLSQIQAAAAQDAKAAVSSYSGAQLITFGDGAQSQTLALIDASTAVAGNLSDVKAALDRRAAPAAISAAVMARINQLSTTEDVWSISTASFASLPFPGATGGTSGSAVLQSIQQASAGLKFGSQVQLDAQAVTASAQDATSLGDVVKLLAQMVEMHTSSSTAPGQVASLLKNLVVSTDQNIVKVSITLPEDQIESLFKMAESEHGAPARI